MKSDWRRMQRQARFAEVDFSATVRPKNKKKVLSLSLSLSATQSESVIQGFWSAILSRT